MSETPQLTSEQLAAGREKRRVRLFERHCDGARLTADERAEIADLIAAGEKSAAENNLTLEPAPAARINKRTGLAHQLQHYADLLEVGLRTVKRWVSDGVKAKDACPLDDLAKFGAWWKRVHPGRSLDSRVALSIERVLRPRPVAAKASGGTEAEVVSAIASPRGGQEGAASAVGSVPPVPTAEPPKPLIVMDDVAAITLEQNLARLKTIHAANMELLERAFKAGSHAELDDRQRKAERSQRMLLDAQNALDAHLKQRGDLLDREATKRELLRIHTAMAQSLIGLLKQLGITHDRALRIGDTWLGHLRQSRFATDTAPVLNPPPSVAAA